MSTGGLATGVVSVVCLLACTAPPADLLRVVREPQGSAVRLRLIPASGARINARLRPRLERLDGTVLEFAGTELTVDSAYFTQPPVLVVDRDPTGVIRASVCPVGQTICRVVVVSSGR